MEQKISKKYINKLKKNFADNLDLVDFRAEFDNSISEEENYNHLEERYMQYLKQELKDRLLLDSNKADLEEQKEKEENEKAKEYEKKQNEINKEYKKKLKEIKINPTPNIDRITWVIEEFIKLTLNNKTDKHSIIISGKAGIGKTFLVKKVLRKLFKPEELKKIIKNGHISPLSYYNLLYDNPDDTFFFDDISGLEQSDAGISLLKQTTETEKDRFVCYSSTTGKLENRIPYFFFKGKQLFCFNYSPKSKKFQPILSRIRTIEFNPTYKEILIMMYEIIKYRWKNIDLKQKIKIVDFIERNTSEVTKHFDLRLLNDIIDVYVYCNGINQKFKEMCGKIIEIDKDKEVVLELMNSKLSVKEQVKEFKEKTNKSRATYFNIKKEIIEII